MFDAKKHPVGSKVMVRIGEGLCWVGEVQRTGNGYLVLCNASCVTYIVFKHDEHGEPWEGLPEPLTGEHIQPQNADLHSPFCFADTNEITCCRAYEGDLPYVSPNAEANCIITFRRSSPIWVAKNCGDYYQVGEMQPGATPGAPVRIHTIGTTGKATDAVFIATMLADILPKKP